VARAALALPMEHTGEDGAFSTLTFTGGIEGRTQFGDETFSGTLLAQNIVFAPGGEDEAIAGFANITGEHTTPGGVTATFAVEGKFEEGDTHQVAARGGVRFRF
jgi:hypothetical protein